MSKLKPILHKIIIYSYIILKDDIYSKNLLCQEIKVAFLGDAH